jgi:hypothetical protein
VLAGAALALAASRVLEPRRPRGPVYAGGRRLPVLCPIRRLTGHRCPGCGMTRGCVYALRLEPLNAIRANPLSPLVVAFGLRAVVGALSPPRTGRSSR